MDIEKANHDDKWISILISFLFVFIMMTGFINNVVNLFYPTQVDTALCYAVLLLLIVKAAIPIVKRLTRYDFLTIVIVGLVFFISAFFYRYTSYYIIDFMPKFLLVVFPYFFLGRVIRDFDMLCKYLRPAMLAAALFGAGSYLVIYVSGQTFLDDDMAFAYHYLPCVIFLMYELFQRFSIKNLFLSSSAFRRCS